MAFVGNAEATHDTVAVKITPEAAYENWDDVDFEIELTNAGPMHDSEYTDYRARGALPVYKPIRPPRRITSKWYPHRQGACVLVPLI